MLVLCTGSPGAAKAIEILEEEEGKKREEQACYLKPQHAAGVGDGLPEGGAQLAAALGYGASALHIDRGIATSGDRRISGTAPKKPAGYS